MGAWLTLFTLCGFALAFEVADLAVEQQRQDDEGPPYRPWWDGQ